MVQDSKPSLDNNIITHPAHYIEGRVFEPISVIEAFGLCHHLSCLVKYIARAGRKTSALNDLKKGEWYLDLELSRSQSRVGLCASPLSRRPGFKITAICEDWKLSPHLSEVLSCILQYRLATASHARFHLLRGLIESSDSRELSGAKAHLVKALEHLRLEIAAHDMGAKYVSDQGGDK